MLISMNSDEYHFLFIFFSHRNLGFDEGKRDWAKREMIVMLSGRLCQM